MDDNAPPMFLDELEPVASDNFQFEEEYQQQDHKLHSNEVMHQEAENSNDFKPIQSIDALPMEHHQSEMEGSDLHYHCNEQISNLKQANTYLKQQMAELNKMLDQHLAAKGIKVPVKPVKRTVSDKEKAFLKQIDYYKKLVEDLQRQVYGSANVDKIIALENQVKEKKKELDTLVEENKGFRNQVREQSRALERLSADKTVDQISNDYKLLKTQNAQVRDQLADAKSEIEKQNERYLKLQQKYDKLDEALKSSNISVDMVAVMKKLKSDMEERDASIADLRKKLEIESKSKQSSQKMLRIEIAQLQQEVKRLTPNNTSGQVPPQQQQQPTKLNLKEVKRNSSAQKSPSDNGSVDSANKKPTPPVTQKRNNAKKNTSGKPLDRGNSKIPKPKDPTAPVVAAAQPMPEADFPQFEEDFENNVMDDNAMVSTQLFVEEEVEPKPFVKKNSNTSMDYKPF